MDLILKYDLVNNKAAVITAIGELDTYTSPRLRQLVIELVESGHIWLIIDLSDIEFMSSTGLGVIVGALKRTHARQGGISLVAREERVVKIFRITGLSKLIKIFDEVPPAIQGMVTRPFNFRMSSTVALTEEDELGWHWFPARIYTSEKTAGMAVQKALQEVLTAFEMEIAVASPIQRRSWFREFIVRMKDSTALPTRDELLALMQRAIEQQARGLPMSKIDVTQSQAVADLVIALDKTPNAVVQCGSVLIVKVQGTIVVRNLTQLEIAHWERNPSLFRNPEQALQLLQRAWEDDSTRKSDPADASWVSPPAV